MASARLLTHSHEHGTAPMTDPFGRFRYPTVPLHVSDDFMNTALGRALAPAFAGA